jgi:Flp pilus assembly protein TadD
VAVARNRMDRGAPGYRLALALTEQRLAIELALTALRLGRTAEAVDHLTRASHPAPVLCGVSPPGERQAM